MTTASRLLSATLLLTLLVNSSAAAPATTSATAHQQWMELHMQGSKIGFAYQNIEKNRAGYQITSRYSINLEVEGKRQEVASSNIYQVDEKLHTISFSSARNIMGSKVFTHGTVHGKKVTLKITSGGRKTERILDFPQNSVLADGLLFILGKDGIKTGIKKTYPIFMEQIFAMQSVTVEVVEKLQIKHNGVDRDVFHVISRFKNFELHSYITGDGTTLREESPMGIVATQTDEKTATTMPDKAMDFRKILNYSLIPISPPIKAQQKIKRASYIITGLAKGVQIPSTNRQQITLLPDGSTKVTVTPPTEASSSMKIPITDKDMMPYLAPTLEAESDHPEIVNLAKKIIGKENRLMAATEKINRWVNRNLEKKFVDSFSAIDTLHKMEGECQSHTNLFTALARSSGIPVRVAAGVVYAPEYGGFLYHAWAEVWDGNRWIAVDPTYGQKIADATHIKLMEGDLSNQLESFLFIGKMKIKVESLQK